MEKRRIKRGILLVGVICLLLAGGYFLHQNSHVRFKDENMGIVICNTIGHGVTPETVRYKDLETIQYLAIGCVGCYTTLIDLEKCKNVEQLYINGNIGEYDPAYEATHNEKGKTLTEEDAARIERELGKMIPGFRNLRIFSYSVYSPNCDVKNWSFLEECKSLDQIYIYGTNTTDYSFLNSFSNLSMISLWGSQIETADSLLNLQDPERLCIFETPLGENEEEIQKLCEALPDTEILISGGRIENKRE